MRDKKAPTLEKPNTLTDSRLKKFDGFKHDAWYSKQFVKLKAVELLFCREWIKENGELDRNEWEVKVNQIWLDSATTRPKNGMLMMEMLCASKDGSK